jgi:hypothetical protein
VCPRNRKPARGGLLTLVAAKDFRATGPITKTGRSSPTLTTYWNSGGAICQAAALLIACSLRGDYMQCARRLHAPLANTVLLHVPPVWLPSDESKKGICRCNYRHRVDDQNDVALVEVTHRIALPSARSASDSHTASRAIALVYRGAHSDCHTRSCTVIRSACSASVHGTDFRPSQAAQVRWL